MTEFPVPDCLVLKIEEHDAQTKDLDTTLYILYDEKYRNFLIRGRRSYVNNIQPCEYSFLCKSVHELVYFITFVISKKNLWTYAIFNYDNLPVESDNISFDYLYTHDNDNIELAAYDKIKYKKKDLINNVKMLKNVFNYYN